MRRRDANLQSVVAVAQQLAKLDVQSVFTGGAVVGLLLTDSAAPDVRPTDDVDVIVAITQYSKYAILQEELRKLGFRHDIGGPNCRFNLDGLTVDIMPSEGKVLGFTNRWYKYALDSATELGLPDGTSIHIVAAPAFVATKLDAFNDRGRGEFVLSHDIEDIIAVVDGRPELRDEIASADSAVRQFISSSFAKFLQDQDFIESVKMSLLPDDVSQSRANLIIGRMRLIAAL